MKTFIDDPLRVLRVIRFTQRYGLKIEDSILAAAQDPKVQSAYESKISPERIMKEMDKMFEGRNPHISVMQMNMFKILPISLKPPANIAELTPELVDNLVKDSEATANVMGALFSTLR